MGCAIAADSAALAAFDPEVILQTQKQWETTVQQAKERKELRHESRRRQHDQIVNSIRLFDYFESKAQRRPPRQPISPQNSTQKGFQGAGGARDAESIAGSRSSEFGLQASASVEFAPLGGEISTIQRQNQPYRREPTQMVRSKSSLSIVNWAVE